MRGYAMRYLSAYLAVAVVFLGGMTALVLTLESLSFPVAVEVGIFFAVVIKTIFACAFMALKSNLRIMALDSVLGQAQLRNWEDSAFKDIVDLVGADIKRLMANPNKILYLDAGPGILATIYSSLSALGIFVIERMNRALSPDAT